MKTAIANLLIALRYACLVTGVAAAGQFSFAETHEVLTGGEVGVTYEFQITTSPPPPEGTEYSASDLPPGLAINSSTGLISGEPTTAGVFEGSVTFTYPSLESDTLPISITIASASGTPVITSATTASGAVDEVFSYIITADNSPDSYNVEGALPSGVSFAVDALSGTPTEPGTFEVQLSGNNASGTGAEVTLTITIAPAGDVPAITSSASLKGSPDEQLSYQITATHSPTSYSASGLPPGMSIDTGTGFISGTPTVAGTYSIDLTATNANGTSEVFVLTAIIGALPEISSSLALSLTENTAMTAYQLSASNSPTSFTVATQSLPSGLSYSSSTKQITGTPTATGTFNVSVYASNALGDGPAATLSITVTTPVVIPDYRPAAFSVQRVDGELAVYIHFDQSSADLATYDYYIETSTDLQAWTEVAIDDASLDVTIKTNTDGSQSAIVRLPEGAGDSDARFVRYLVKEKTP